jgi:hypothetical protein
LIDDWGEKGEEELEGKEEKKMRIGKERTEERNREYSIREEEYNNNII